MIIGSKVLTYKELTSTNTEASRLLKESEQPEGTVVSAEFQSAGRGQAGNKWESSKGKNLLFSIILYPDTMLPENQFLLSMSISLGICDFFDCYIDNATIKWPNDIYVRNDKIAGILIENTIMGEMIESSITGIGLNVNQETFPPGILNPVSLKMIKGKEYNLVHCLDELLAILDGRYKQLLYNDREILRYDYISRLYRLNEWHMFKKEGALFKGRIIDVLRSGKLKVEESTGQITEFSFKEIEYVI